ncbi:MAG: hypothetical protein ACHQ49_08875 [Elusimicrobiota bacterium]
MVIRALVVLTLVLAGPAAAQSRIALPSEVGLAAPAAVSLAPAALAAARPTLSIPTAGPALSIPAFSATPVAAAAAPPAAPSRAAGRASAPARANRIGPADVEAAVDRVARDWNQKPLEDYVHDSKALPKSFNVLALRNFQRKAGILRFTKLDPRYSASFKAVYGPRGSDRLAKSLGSPIDETLGTGWMGRVVSLKDGRTVKTIIREGSRTSKIGILFETEAWMTYHLQQKLDRYGIKVLPIIAVGPDGMYLEKPLVDAKTIGSRILKTKKKLSGTQMARLRILHRSAVGLAEETGVPIDLKADNVFWDGSDWVLLDPVGNISRPASYGKTLDVRDFDEFYLKWAGKKPPSDKGLTIDRVVKQFPMIQKDYDRSSRK